MLATFLIFLTTTVVVSEACSPFEREIGAQRQLGAGRWNNDDWNQGYWNQDWNRGWNNDWNQGDWYRGDSRRGWDGDGYEERERYLERLEAEKARRRHELELERYLAESRAVGGLKGDVVVETSEKKEEELLTDDKTRVISVIDTRKEGPIEMFDGLRVAGGHARLEPVEMIDRLRVGGGHAQRAGGHAHIAAGPVEMIDRLSGGRAQIVNPVATGLRHKQISDAIGANIRNHFMGLGKRDAEE